MTCVCYGFLPCDRAQDFFHTVAMPETMGMVACVEAPPGGRRRWELCLLHGVFHPFDRRWADLQLGDVPEFPGQAFRTKPWLHLNEAASLFLHLAREAPRRQTGRRPFGEAGQLTALPQALNRAGRRRLRASLGVDLGGTPGRMALGQLHKRLFPCGGQAIVGTRGPRAVIR